VQSPYCASATYKASKRISKAAILVVKRPDVLSTILFAKRPNDFSKSPYVCNTSGRVERAHISVSKSPSVSWGQYSTVSYISRWRCWKSIIIIRFSSFSFFLVPRHFTHYSSPPIWPTHFALLHLHLTANDSIYYACAHWPQLAGSVLKPTIWTIIETAVIEFKVLGLCNFHIITAKCWTFTWTMFICQD
jgi:hypothetical protein